MTMLAINWGNALIITVIGFALVFVVLLLLIGIIKLFGMIFASKPVQQPAEASVAESRDEEMAAVAFALHLYYDVMTRRATCLPSSARIPPIGY